MTKTIKYLVFFAFCIQLYTACQPENISMPDMGRKIVINGLMTTDSLLSVFVNKSAYVSDTDNVFRTDLNNAKAYIYENNICIDSLYHTWSQGYNQYEGTIQYGGSNLYIYGQGNYWSKSVKPLPGHEYKIVVKAPGSPDAAASTRIPNMVRIEHIDTITALKIPQTLIGGGYNDGVLHLDTINTLYKIMKCNIEFTDPGNETNYYLFNICSGQQPKESSRYLTFVCKDPVVEEKIVFNSVVIEGIAFSDKIINGKKYSLTVDIVTYFDLNPLSSYFRDKSTVYFRLYSIPEAYFKYIQSLNLYNAKFGKPLSEPVQVYSNITGGLGIFAGAAVSADSIVFRP